jgi:AAA15 family ATPase/GTPase
MRLNKLNIRNYKSLTDFTLQKPRPFSVFVGPNASGKSNIFEALEFTNFSFKYSSETPMIFGGFDTYSYKPSGVAPIGNAQSFYYEFEDGIIIHFHFNYNSSDLSPIGSRGYTVHQLRNIQLPNPFDLRDSKIRGAFLNNLVGNNIRYDFEYEQFVDRFCRIFIGNRSLVRFLGSPNLTSTTLLPDASNLAQILGRIFSIEEKKEDFNEWLSILIPEFDTIEITDPGINGKYDYQIFEKGSRKPFPKNLLSDGTKNILALLASVYQDSQPQFLCIEEPENGLHPQAIRSLVDFFREKSESEGHYIWLNTHSQSLVRCLQAEEIILINKVNGITTPKQLTEKDRIEINTDEAWLTNAFGGGTLWSR